MKKVSILLLVTLLLLVGCNSTAKNNEQTNKENPVPTTENPVKTNENDTDKDELTTKHVDTDYGFTEFNLDIEVDKKDVVEAEYDKYTDSVEAELKNKLQNTKLKGDAAMDELDKLFNEIKLTKDSPEQEVIDKILKWFNIETYSEFKLEVDFNDGTTLDIEKLQ